MTSIDVLPQAPDGSTGLTRRTFVAGAIGAAVVSAAPFELRRSPRAEAATGARCWSSDRGWGGAPPEPGAVVVVRDRVLLDTDAIVGGLVIEQGGAVIFDSSKSVTLASTGSVVVRGVLQMAPVDCSVDHLLRFDGIDESRFVGAAAGGDERTDIGLWVRGSGRLLLDGCARTPWVRADGDLRRGTTLLKLRQAPEDWHRGDELVVLPTGSPAGAGHADRYDTVKIRSVNGRTVKISRPLAFDHPAVAVGRGTVVSAEVMNLTRNVRIEGRKDARAHVHVMTDVPQDMRNFALRHVGPRQAAAEYTDPILGRYGLHFHMAGNASRGSLVSGAVIRDCGSHAYVPHGSHGITFRGCISHNTMEDAFWWDGAPDTRTPQVETNDLTYDSCIASGVSCDPSFRGYRLTGFSLGRGIGNTAVNCVAAGVRGNKNASGFLWPEGGIGVWRFSGCVAHNNQVNGIFTWQNTGADHVVTRFVGYHNGQAGIEHGAYLNGYRYENSILYGNGQSSVRVHAMATAKPRLTLDNLWCDGAGVAAHGIELVRHTLPSTAPMKISRSVLRGHRVAALALLAIEGPDDFADVIDCDVRGNEIVASDGWVGGSVRWSDPGRGSFRVVPASEGGGTVVPEWNAARKAIPDFASPTASPDRRSLTPLSASPTKRRRGLTTDACVAGAGGGSYSPGSTADPITEHDGHHAPPVAGITARLVRGERGQRHLAFLVIENPAGRTSVELTADGRRVRDAVARRGRTTVKVRIAKLRGRTVRLMHDSQVVGHWRVPAR